MCTQRRVHFKAELIHLLGVFFIASTLALHTLTLVSFPTAKTPHFLRLQSVEVNAGQFATFQCTATGGTDSSDRLWLQVISFFSNALVFGERRDSERNVKCEKLWAVHFINIRFYCAFELLHGRYSVVENATGRFSCLVSVECLTENKGTIFLMCGHQE